MKWYIYFTVNHAACIDFQDRSDKMKKYFKKSCRDLEDEGAWHKQWSNMMNELKKTKESKKHRKALNEMFDDDLSGENKGWL